MQESQLVYQVMQALGKHGAVYRCNSGSVKLPNGKRFHAMPRGFSDVMVVLPQGKVAFIECKTSTGKSNPQQERFLSKMQGMGAMAGIARNVNDALEICGLAGRLNEI